MKRTLLSMFALAAMSATALAADIKPAIIYDLGGKFDKSFNESAYNGAEKFKEETGIEYREFEIQNDAQREQALRRFARDGNNPIVMAGFSWAAALEDVADDYPDINFAIIDMVVDKPNVRSVVYKEQEGSYLVGVMAAMASESGTVSFIGGMDIPLIRKFACGYVQGVKAANPDATVLQNMTGTTPAAWSDPSKGAELARSQIDRGADVIARRVARAAEHVVKRPKLRTATEVMKSIIPPPCKSSPSGNGPAPEERAEIMGTADMAAMDQPLHMAKSINLALTDLMLEFGNIIVAGEDVGPKGGVYGVTQRLHDRFGPARVINTLLDEQSILGLGIGLAHNGILPILEIQFLAYLHNAEDQLRGEASTLSFFSNGQFTNPMIVRIAGLGYQRGFGGHFHNDNSLAVLLDIPGIIVACPSNARDAVLMLRESVRLAKEEQRIIVFVEPIALYMTRDLHESKDTAWSFTYPKPGDGASVSLGEVGIWGDGSDLAIVTYGNGTFLSCQAKRILEEEHGIQVRVVDLRWLAPLPSQSLEDAISGCRHVLIVDECRISGSQSAALMAFMSEHSKVTDSFARIAADDSFIPTGPSYAATLPSRESVVEASRRLVMKTAQRRIS